MHTRTTSLLVASLLLVLPLCANAQPSASSAPPPTSMQPSATSPEMTSDLVAYAQMLSQLQQVSQQTAADLGRMKVDRWKADASVKQQCQTNANSLQRNLTAALPEMIQKTKAAPQELAPSFKLYRNLNAVYDVLSATAESAGAFGPKEKYDPLVNDAGAIEQLRRSLADRLDWLSGIKDGQLIQLRQQLVAAQQAKPKVEAPATTPATKKKAPRKKKTLPETAPATE